MLIFLGTYNYHRLYQVVADVEKEFNQEAREFTSKKRRLATTKEEVSNLTLGQDIAILLEEAVDPLNLEVKLWYYVDLRSLSGFCIRFP